MARSGLVTLLCCLVFLRTLTFVSFSPALRVQRSVKVLQQATATDDTMTKVADVIAEQLGVESDKVTREATLTELGADSLDIVESVMALEEAFDIELPDEERLCGELERTYTNLRDHAAEELRRCHGPDPEQALRWTSYELRSPVRAGMKAMARSWGVLLLGLMLFRTLSFVSFAPQVPRSVKVLRQATATDDTMDKVAGVIAEQLGVEKDKVTREATLTELGADSLDIVESVMALEEEFDIELPDEETTPLKNCGDVMDLIQSKL
ncbi:unnamed protein product [Cladocopium goreaui]|uniref:Acyl carrier protein n=1 Tax=Cladocopium goreaui TaxID=2562237 RepID=A0A9P1FUV1_9DINO|nr:unnamed protein product [Cladocopium goreaui]